MKKTVLTPLLALLITGCGGGDGEQEETPIRPPVTPNYFEASSQSSAGGQLNPTSLRLAAGEQGRFSVQADSGYLLTEISGCDGTLDGLTYTTGPIARSRPASRRRVPPSISTPPLKLLRGAHSVPTPCV
ncbi:hypothetical protein ACK34I_11050 [Aeromonas veronii]